MVSHGKGAWSPDRYNVMIAARVALMMVALGHATLFRWRVSSAWTHFNTSHELERLM